jgi:predicted acetyltransferase
VSKDSATHHSDYVPFAHFFFASTAAKKKFTKRNGVFACAASATARGATAFEKAVQNNRLVQCEHTYKSQFINLSKKRS